MKQDTGDLGQRDGNSQGITPDSHQIAEELRRIVSEIAGIEPRKIRLSSRLREGVGVDSFTALEILVAIENRFGIRVSEEKVRDMALFSDLVRFIQHNSVKIKK